MGRAGQPVFRVAGLPYPPGPCCCPRSGSVAEESLLWVPVRRETRKAALALLPPQVCVQSSLIFL